MLSSTSTMARTTVKAREGVEMIIMINHAQLCVDGSLCGKFYSLPIVGFV
jgi:hypothetical protein